jgi:large subunit ribosomal protein L3
LGYNDVKSSRRKNPQVGHAQKANSVPKKFVKEMRLLKDTETGYKVGDSLTVSVFVEDKYVDVVGTSKGKGFAGVMKRHGFHGFPASHGTERKHRAPGSIGSFASDRGHGGRIKKGKKMAGHMGNHRVTTKNHSLVVINEEKNLLVVKGSIPGPPGGYVVVRSAQKA